MNLQIQDKHIIWLAIIMLTLVFATLYHIFSFMPLQVKCQPSFDIINKCHCIPDEHLAKLFNKEEAYLLHTPKLNLTNSDFPQ